MTEVADVGILSFTGLPLGYDKLNIMQYFLLFGFGIVYIGDIFNFSTGGEVKEPVIQPFPTSSAVFSKSSLLVGRTLEAGCKFFVFST